VSADQEHDFRCHACSKLIAKVSDVTGVVVEAKCPRCGEITKARLEEEQARG
jgi:phage FluMu protein Com